MFAYLRAVVRLRRSACCGKLKILLVHRFPFLCFFSHFPSTKCASSSSPSSNTPSTPSSLPATEMSSLHAPPHQLTSGHETMVHLMITCFGEVRKYTQAHHAHAQRTQRSITKLINAQEEMKYTGVRGWAYQRLADLLLLQITDPLKIASTQERGRGRRIYSFFTEN